MATISKKVVNTAHSPFLKWAGNKLRVLPHLLPHIPVQNGRFIEPFVGSGSVFLNVKSDARFSFSSYVVGDYNQDLVDLYDAVVKDPQGTVDRTTLLFDGNAQMPHGNSRARYEYLRDVFNGKAVDSVLTQHGIGKPELFVYLNRHCFNGLCRYNSSGEFNVPFGTLARAPSVPADAMLGFHRVAQGVRFVGGDCAALLAQLNPGSGDVVYLDPPYVPLSITSSFTSYSKGVFGLTQQQELADVANHYAGQGAVVLVSNHDTPLVRQLYQGATIHAFNVQRFVSAKASSRKAAPELLAVFQ